MDPTDEKIYLNGLNILYQSSYAKIFPLFKEYLNKNQIPSFKNIWENLDKEIREKIDLEKEWRKLEKEKIELITFKNNLYPPLLKQIPYPPLGLYLKGTLTNNSYPLAVVGTRKPTIYGKMVVSKIIQGLCYYGITIISGLAYGIDTLVHKAVLENKGKTIAVLASGFNNITPVTNKNLALKIIEKGALVSEYHPQSLSLKYNFPWRNRIISGLALGTLVIEAKEKSGALITANFAFKQKRKVFAIPGSIFSQTSLGTNNLIKKGAKLVNKAEEIVEEICPQLLKTEKEFKLKNLNLNEKENLILKILKEDELISLDKILEMTNLKANEAMIVLTELELKGLINEVKSGYYLKETNH
ncbi:MAG: DNA-processing protein DprA [Minisyncoccia bacterium]